MKLLTYFVVAGNRHFTYNHKQPFLFPLPDFEPMNFFQ